VFPALRRLRKEFEASLGYTVSSSQPGYIETLSNKNSKIQIGERKKILTNK
jgi:hypothetical protein